MNVNEHYFVISSARYNSLVPQETPFCNIICRYLTAGSGSIFIHKFEYCYEFEQPSSFLRSNNVIYTGRSPQPSL